jgi:hypothetical protein
VAYFDDIRGNTLMGEYGQADGGQATYVFYGSGIWLSGEIFTELNGLQQQLVQPDWTGFGASVSGNTLSSAAQALVGNTSGYQIASIIIGPATSVTTGAPLYVDTLVYNNTTNGNTATASATYPQSSAIANGIDYAAFDPAQNDDFNLNYPYGTIICSNQRDANWPALETDSYVAQLAVLPPPNANDTLPQYRLQACVCASDGVACANGATCCSGYCANGVCAGN